MSCLFANVTVNRLPPIPHLTAITTYHYKTRNAIPEVNTHNTSGSRNVRKIGPMLIANALNLTIMTQCIINIGIWSIIRVIIHNNINPIWGRGRRWDNIHLNPAHIQLTPQLDTLTSSLIFEGHTRNLIATLLDLKDFNILASKMIKNCLCNVSINNTFPKFINLKISSASHIVKRYGERRTQKAKTKKLSPDGRGPQPDG